VNVVLVVAMALGTVGALVVLRRVVFPPKRDDPAIVARMSRNLGRLGLRRCPHCDRLMPVAQADCPCCRRSSEPEA
jgi:hypothetical protein